MKGQEKYEGASENTQTNNPSPPPYTRTNTRERVSRETLSQNLKIKLKG